MKATATVPPFLNFNMRAHQEHQTPVSNNSADGGGEGGFAAALRKLAQQTPGGFTSRLMPRGDAMLSPSGKSMIGMNFLFLLFCHFLKQQGAGRGRLFERIIKDPQNGDHAPFYRCVSMRDCY